MATKHKYEELEKRVEELEREAIKRKQAEEALRTERSTFFSILQTAPYGVVLVDQSGAYQYINPEFTRITGYTLEDVPTGREWLQKGFPDSSYRKKIANYWYEDISKKGSSKVLRVTCKDGEEKELDIWPTLMGDGRAIMMLSDVTERKQAEEALRESEERFRMLAENAPFGISIMKPDLSFEYFNPKFTEILGYTINDVPNRRTWFENAYPDAAYRDEVIAIWRKDLNEDRSFEEVTSRIFTVRCKDGQDKIIHFRTIGLKDGKRFISYEDITSQMKAEEALKQSERHYRTLVEESFDGIFIQKGPHIIFANQRLHEMLGYNDGELVGLEHWLVYHPEYQQLTSQRAQARLRGEPVPSMYEVKLQRKDKTWLYGEINAKATTVEGEAGIQVWVRDISERKRADEELRRSEERYRSLFERLPVGLFRSTPDGRFLDANSAFMGLLGCPDLETLLKIPATEFYKDPEERSQWKKLTEKEEGSRAYEVQWKKLDGTPIWVRESARAVKDAEGTVFYYEGAAEDITEFKQAEEALRMSEERYRSLYESSIDGIVYSDLKGNIIDANPSFLRMLNYSKEELTQLSNRDITPQKWQDAEIELVREQIFSKGYSAEWEKEYIAKDGSIIPVSISAWLIRDKDGAPSGVWGIVRDITELKRVEEEKRTLETQLQYAQKMEAIGTLAGGIAHNFNNLLMGIQGNTSLMLLETDPSHANYARLMSIENSIQSGSKLTSQLLGYAREGRYEVKPLDVNQLVRETSGAFATAKREIRFHQELAEELWGVMADQGQLEQVMLNLFVNAAEAMPKGGDLFVKTEKVTHHDLTDTPYKMKPGNYVLISVRDSGMGMDQKTMERIFEPFFTTKGLSRGTGLGLASVYGIIKAHAGYIDVKSKKGEGTTFSIYLPASGKKLREKHGRSFEIVTGTGTVLLADDEEVILDVGTKMLETLGYRVMVARGGKETIDIYEENRDTIDLIILDMIMPDMGGGDTFGRLKEINPNVRVLLSSGYSIDGRAQEIMGRGCDAFIQKPFRMEELSQKIREIVKQRHP